MVALGRPVVPEVNASSATSSAAVSISWNVLGCLSSALTNSAPTSTPGPMAASIQSCEKRSSTTLKSIWAISLMVRISTVRNAGIEVTAIAPVLSTASQVATSHWLFGMRISTRLPGCTPYSSVSRLAI